ncbi:hypothetical protein Hanom_Chr04g00317391 [Helianthus anomalus]
MVRSMQSKVLGRLGFKVVAMKTKNWAWHIMAATIGIDWRLKMRLLRCYLYVVL